MQDFGGKKLKQVSKLKEPHSILKNTEEMIRPEAILIFERSPQLIRKKDFFYNSASKTFSYLLSPRPSFRFTSNRQCRSRIHLKLTNIKFPH
jgi:hypothetical protein